MKTFAAIVFILLSTSASFSWSDMGHRYTALVTYNSLSEEKRDSILDLLTFHPDYKAHFFDEMPSFVVERKDLHKPWLFSQMAVWADVIKRQELNYSPQHRRWHYINYPIYLNEIDERYYKNNVPVNLELEAEGEESDDWNIAQAFQYNYGMLDSGSNAQKAVALCWIFHLIGDIHQPLHSTALYNERRFPKGDLGGNAISVKGIGAMHVAWDRSTYNSENKSWEFDDHLKYSEKLSSSQMGNLEEILEDSTFESWLLESHGLAKEIGYPAELLEKVRESKIERYGFGNPLNVKLSKEFTASFKDQITETSLIQITKSGYRLAKLLKAKF